MKISGRVTFTLVGARYMKYAMTYVLQLFLGFLVLGVEIAEFEFTDCIRYRYT